MPAFRLLLLGLIFAPMDNAMEALSIAALPNPFAASVCFLLVGPRRPLMTSQGATATY